MMCNPCSICYTCNYYREIRSAFIQINVDYVILLHEAGYTLTDIACQPWRRLQEIGIALMAIPIYQITK